MMRLLFIALPVLLPSLDSALAQEGDPASGEQVFRRCMACHAVGENARNKVGPVLNGVVGAPWAHRDDYNYSQALKEGAAEGRVWDEETLSAFLQDPRAVAPGTKMAFPGLKDLEDVANVIAYLKTVSE